MCGNSKGLFNVGWLFNGDLLDNFATRDSSKSVMSPSILDYSLPHQIVSNAWWLFKRGDNNRSSFVRIARRWLQPLDRGCQLGRFITDHLMDVHLYIGIYWTQD